MASIRHRYTGVEYKTVTKFMVNYKDVFVLDDLYLKNPKAFENGKNEF